MSTDHDNVTPNPDVTPTLPGSVDHVTQDLNKQTNTQKQPPGSPRIGEILVKKGVLTESRLKVVLDKQKKMSAAGKDVSLGKLIVDSGIVTPSPTPRILTPTGRFERVGWLQNN